MTKKGLLMLLSIFSLVCMFTGCNDDDKIEIIQDGEFVGVYKGALDVKLGGAEVAKDMPQKIYITLVADAQNQIKMELKNFSFGSMVLGDIAVDKCDVIKKGNTCTFTGNQKLTLPVIGECDVKLKGSIINDKIQLDIDVAATEAGSAIQVAVVFNGAKLTADQSSAAKIETFTFESEYVTSQPVIEGKNITFIVADTIPAEALAALVPTFTISAKATVTPASGVAQDFSKPVTYKVTSEDGIVTTEYTVSVAGKSTLYTFDDWMKITQDGNMYDLPVGGQWASADKALALIKMMLGTINVKFDDYSVVSSDDSKRGRAATVKTLDTHGMPSIMPGYFPAIPKITAGSLFLGAFDVDAMNTLRSTRFGIPFAVKPIIVKGYYKYTPGKVYYRCDNVNNSNEAVEDESKTDEFSISAVLYEVSSFDYPSDPYDPSDERLNGTNIYTSDKIVASAQLVDGSAKSDWTAFDLKLTYVKDYDPTKKYRFAVICSSSKDGDKFCGAPNSTLLIDDIEIVSE